MSYAHNRFYAPLGVTPSAVIPRPTFIPGMMTQYRDIPFPEGPRAQVGPFNFPAAGGKYRVTKQWLYSPAGKPTMDWLSIQLGTFMQKYGIQQCVQTAIPCYPRWPLDSKTWDLQFSAPNGVKYGLPYGMWRGDVPLAKITQQMLPDGTTVPLPKPMGLYVRWETGQFTVEYKQIPDPNIIERIVSAIVELIATIIETIQQLFDFIGDATPNPPPVKPPTMSDEEYANILRGWQQLQAANVNYVNNGTNALIENRLAAAATINLIALVWLR